MKIKPFTLILFALFALFLAACGGASNEPTQVEVTRVVSETVAVEGEAVIVTHIVVEQSADVAVEVAAEESMTEAPIAIAPQSAPAEQIAPLPTPSPMGTAVPPRDMFFQDYGVNPYILTSADNLSTFSLDVDTGSYSIARRYLNDGLMPPQDAIRVEEFVNSFNQGYLTPPDTGFAVYADGAPSPFHNDGTYFLRIGVQGYDVAEEFRPAAALTFVIDVSGSMAQENRLGLVKESLQLLVERMRADDTVAIVVYGSTARVVLNPTNGSDRSTILNAIYGLNSEGSTNLEAGLNLGYELANRAYKSGGINRVIIASDGVANVGNISPETLAAQIRGYADSGISLTTIGFGMGNYNDVLMEQLADNGDGNYAYVDNMDEAENLFVDNLMSTLQTIALDAKIQVEFDSNVVQQYRLIGYENRALADQDFRNDNIDAAEFGAGHTAAAIYAVQFMPGANGRIGTVNLRWQDPDTRRVQEISGTFNTWDISGSFESAPTHFQLAVVASQFAELLRGSYWAEGVTYSDLRIWADRLAAQMNDADVHELASLIHQVRDRS